MEVPFKSECMDGGAGPKHMALVKRCGRRGVLLVSALESEASGPGSSPGRGHCVFCVCCVFE